MTTSNDKIRNALATSEDSNLERISRELTDEQIDKLRELFEEAQVTQPLHYYGNKR